MKENHYFYAVPLPKEAKAEIAGWMGEISDSLPFHRWVHPEDLHITLAFLGRTDEESLKKTIQRVKDASKQSSSFSLTVKRIGTFGSPASPRILWTDVSESSSLYAIRDKVYNACQLEGYELDKRPFTPHITIARKWAGETAFRKELLSPFNLSEPLTFEVKEIVLFRTHLERSPKYETVETFMLG